MLVEKPLADTVEAATQLADAADRAGVALLVGHHRRHNPVIEKAREVVQSGGIGNVTAISAQMPPGHWRACRPSKRRREQDAQ
jgi:predicted dehydrogenase